MFKFQWFTKKPIKLQLPNHSLFQNRNMMRQISSYLNDQDHELMNSAPEFKDMTIDLLNSKRLLKYVKEADWNKIEKMYSEEKLDLWELMTQPIHHVLADNKTEEISPLQYAAKILDIYSINTLFRCISKDKTKLILQHIQVQKNHIDLEPLFQVYEEHTVLYQRWSKNSTNKILIQVLDNHWIKQHGKKMLELYNYARHFIKEMCRTDKDWHKDATFDSASLPTDCDVCDYRNIYDLDRLQNVNFLSMTYNLGMTFSIIRGSAKMAFLAYDGHSPILNGTALSTFVNVDLDAFRRLMKVRKDDLAKQISLLDAPSMRVG